MAPSGERPASGPERRRRRATGLRRVPRRSRTLAVAGLLSLSLVAAACGGDDDGAGDGASPPTSTTSAGPAPSSSAAVEGPTRIDGEVVLRGVVEGLAAPTAMAPRPGTDELWVTEQGGTVRRVVATSGGGASAVPGQGGAPASYELGADPALDLGDLTAARGERGLLGIAFSPDGDRLYLHHTAREGDIVVTEHQVAADGSVDASSRRVLLTIPHRDYPNHNGGQLVLGPDGALYVGVGDGGGAGDPLGNAQDTDALLGKVLRIDPTTGGAGEAYGIPEGNPFADGGGAPEVYLYGARNPWRFSFDRATGDLWVADVGQDAMEEIDWLPASTGAGVGANLGWNWFEGDEPYADGTPPDGLVPPIFTYPHEGDVCSVTGGYVYRGEAVPALEGVYVYGDYCVGELRGLLARDGEVLDERALGPNVGQGLMSFGQDLDGELYALTSEGALLRLEAG